MCVGITVQRVPSLPCHSQHTVFVIVVSYKRSAFLVLTSNKLLDSLYYTVSATRFTLPLECSHLYVVSDIIGIGCLTLTARRSNVARNQNVKFLVNVSVVYMTCIPD